jgi:hypothetical protein
MFNVSLNLRAKKPWLNSLTQAASIRSVNTSAYSSMMFVGPKTKYLLRSYKLLLSLREGIGWSSYFCCCSDYGMKYGSAVLYYVSVHLNLQQPVFSGDIQYMEVYEK